jgi:hypothetical protein
MFLKLMWDGGPFMWAVLLFGAIMVLTAAWFAWRAEQRVSGFIDVMARALIAAVLAALARDLMVVFGVAARTRPEQRTALILNGAAESLSPLLLGFVLLAVSYFLAAIGQRRLDARRASAPL